MTEVLVAIEQHRVAFVIVVLAICLIGESWRGK